MWVWSLFQRQCLGWNCQEHCHGPPATTCQADCSTILWFSGNCTAGAAWRYTSSFEAKVVVSLWWSFYALWGRCLAVVECNLFRKVDWTSRVMFMASLVAGSDLMDIFPVGTLEGTNYVVPPRTIEYLVTGPQAAVTLVDGNVVRHVWENAIWHTAVYLEMNGHHWMAIITTRHSWFDSLIGCAI
jgi:hypothetical protein